MTYIHIGNNHCGNSNSRNDRRNIRNLSFVTQSFRQKYPLLFEVVSSGFPEYYEGLIYTLDQCNDPAALKYYEALIKEQGRIPDTVDFDRGGFTFYWEAEVNQETLADAGNGLKQLHSGSRHSHSSANNVLPSIAINNSPSHLSSKEGIMVESAMKALSAVLEMKPGDRLLIITDINKKDIGLAFETGARKLGAEVKTHVLTEKHRPLKEIPDDLDPLLAGNEVVVHLFEAHREEAPFRQKLVIKELSTGSRVGHGVGITNKMVTEGPMTVDYEKMSIDADHLMALLKDAKTAHITTPAGTDVTLGIEDRAFVTDVKIKPGNFGNIPVGEVCCAVVETETNGTIVVDGSIAHLGQVTAPLKIGVKHGAIVSLEGEDEDFVAKVKELSLVDDQAKIMGELGIGLNSGAKITGNLLEDEKAGKTAHIAFGNNSIFPGGKNRSSIHIDLLFRTPTIVVTYKNGTERTVIRDGEVVR